MRVLIVGGGVAAVTVAWRLRQIAFRGEVELLTRESRLLRGWQRAQRAGGTVLPSPTGELGEHFPGAGGFLPELLREAQVSADSAGLGAYAMEGLPADLFDEASRYLPGFCVRTGARISEAAQGESFRLWGDPDGPREGDVLVLACGSGGAGLAAGLGLESLRPQSACCCLRLSEARRLWRACEVPDARVSFRERASTVRGAVTITPWGIGGPTILELTWRESEWLASQSYRAPLQIDWLPALAGRELTSQVDSHARARGREGVAEACPPGLPETQWPCLAELSGIPRGQTWGQLDARRRQRLASRLKAFPLAVEGYRLDPAERPTRGGVALSALDPPTCGARRIPGLYVCGDLADLHGRPGGWSYLAALATARACAAAIANLS